MNCKILVWEWQHLKILPTLTKLLNRPRPSITIQLFYMTTFHSRIPQHKLITDKHAFNFDIISYPFNIHPQKQSNTHQITSVKISSRYVNALGMCSIYIVYVCSVIVRLIVYVCVYIYVIFFLFLFFFHSLSWSPLLDTYLDTSNRRRYVWCPQPYPPYHTLTHRKMLSHTVMEEVTTESTAPLNHICAPPSIKVLFPPNQWKSSFHKFKIDSIKTYTSQHNKNMVHNFYDHTLTEDESSVLSKGFSFVPTSTKTFKQKTYKCWSEFKTRMLTQYFFRNSTNDKTSSHTLNKTSSLPTPHIQRSTAI